MLCEVLKDLTKFMNIVLITFIHIQLNPPHTQSQPALRSENALTSRDMKFSANHRPPGCTHGAQ